MIPIYFIGQFLGVLIALVAAKYINDVKLAPIQPDTTDIVTILR
jgi:hypothetical protein